MINWMFGMNFMSISIIGPDIIPAQSTMINNFSDLMDIFLTTTAVKLEGDYVYILWLITLWLNCIQAIIIIWLYLMPKK